MKLTTRRARREWLRRAFRGYANLTVIINDVVRKWFGPERTRWKSNTITTVDYFIVTLHTRIYSCVRIFSRNCSTRSIFCIRAICSTLFSLDCFLSLFQSPDLRLSNFFAIILQIAFVHIANSSTCEFCSIFNAHKHIAVIN